MTGLLELLRDVGLASFLLAMAVFALMLWRKWVTYSRWVKEERERPERVEPCDFAAAIRSHDLAVARRARREGRWAA